MRDRKMRPAWLLALLLLLLAFAPTLAPYDPKISDEANFGKFKAPTAAHPFGTDKLSRDVFSRVLTASRVSLEISLTAVAIALLLGTTYGVMSALAGGWGDALGMRFIDITLSVPRILLLLPVAAFWPDLPLLVLALLIGITGWFDIARLVRGDTHGVLVRDFVLAARAIGTGNSRLVVRHVVPHLLPTLLVVGTIAIGNTIALEAGLAFLGLGLQSDTPSLGTLLHDSVGSNRWWLSVFPGMAIVLIMLACNALGDTLRDRIAPKQLHA